MKFLDVVKWKNPQNHAESEDVMVVEDVMGVFVEVRHLDETGFLGTSNEKMEDLRVVGRCTAYEPSEGILKRYIKA